MSRTHASGAPLPGRPGGTAGPQRLDLVQALRALAALSVLVAHSLHELQQIGLRTGASYDKRALFPWDCGVDVFFVTSGFIMVYISRREFGQDGASLRFLLERLIRIIPPYWFFTSLVVLTLLLAPGVFDRTQLDVEHILASYAFLPHISLADKTSPILQVGWTLNYEMYFYLVFSAALVLRLRQALPLLALFMLFSVAGGFASEDAPFPVQYWTEPIVLEFLLGAGLGYAFTRGWRLSAWSAAGLLALALAWLIGLHNLDVLDGLPRWIGLGLPAGLIVAGAALCTKAPPRNLPMRALLLLGAASYTLYLSHPFTIGAASLVWRKAGLDAHLHAYAYVPLALSAAVLVAVAFYLLAEAPLHRRLKAKLLAAWDRRTPALPARHAGSWQQHRLLPMPR